jgi:hypothetical protein
MGLRRSLNAITHTHTAGGEDPQSSQDTWLAPACTMRAQEA